MVKPYFVQVPLLEKRAKCAATPRRRPCKCCKMCGDPSARTLQMCKMDFDPSAETLQVLQNVRRPLGVDFADLQNGF